MQLNGKNDFAGKSILVLGAAKSGIAVSRLLDTIGAKVTLVDDQKMSAEVVDALGRPNISVITQKYNSDKLLADLMVISPGIPDSHPLAVQFVNNNRPIYSEIEIASRFTNAPVIAVTGSNGKSTVSAMIHQMMASGGYRSFLGGNIGVPFSTNVLEEFKIVPPVPIHVVEISSFQAEHIHTFKPEAAVFLNLTPDHLDRYEGMEDYGQAKLNLARNMQSEGTIIYNGDDSFFSEAFKGWQNAITFVSAGSIVGVSNNWITIDGKPVIEVSRLPLPGPHNLLNYQAAVTVAYAQGIEADAINNAALQFPGLPHRLERIAVINDVAYYNDSKATNLASCMVALQSFDGNLVLILGGSEKGEPEYDNLIPLIQEKVSKLITYGQAGLPMVEAFRETLPIHYEQTFKAAVEQAHHVCQPGDSVLLSPACASFDQFTSFEHRGEAFREIVLTFEDEANHA